MLRIFFMLFFLQATNCLLAQTTFKKKYGTSGNDWPYYVEVLADNSFFVTGASTGGGLGGQDAILFKIASDGIVEWVKAYGGSGFDIFTHISPCSDGNFLMCGQTNSLGAGGMDIYIVKVDPNGNVLWERTCGGFSIEKQWGICEVSDGYVLSGSTTSFGAGDYDIYVEKLDFNGNSLWSKAWGYSGSDSGGEPFPASNNEVWVSGTVTAGNNIESILLRISANGNLISATQINGAHVDLMVYLSGGGAGITGSGSTTSYTGGSQQQPFLIGFNTSGNLAWAMRYVMPFGSYNIRARDCPDGGLIFSPYRLSGDDNNAYLVKTDGSGNINWAKSYTLPGSGRMYFARPTPDGGYVAVGHCLSATLDIYMIKTDASGNIAGCCPEDASITAVAITPATPSVSLSSASGDPAASATGQNQDVTPTETDLCNGPSCCLTDAGTMLEQTLHACINQPAILTHNGDEVLDNNDLLQFILFSDPSDTLGSIIAVSNTPTFTFDPATMQTGVTYYVAAIAGNNVGGNVDLNDPCFDLSNNAAELIWHPLPEVVLQTDNSNVCPGDCRTLTAVLTGTPPFILTVTSPAGTTTVTIQDNTGTFQICLPSGTPPGSFMVQATTLTDAFCTCSQ